MNYCKCKCGQIVRKTWATGHHRTGSTFTLSEEAKKKISLSKMGKLNPRFGKPSTTLGRKHTPEERQKIKEARAKQVFTPEQNRATSLRLIQ